MEIAPHHGKVHPDLQAETVASIEEVPEMPHRHVKRPELPANSVVDQAGWPIDRYVEAANSGVQNLGQDRRSEADRVGVQMHSSGSSISSEPHQIEGVSANQWLPAGEVDLVDREIH